MSSFLQCSIELLNSYYFVKQKKCKRGLLKSKVLTHGWTVYFPPNFVSNLHPPPPSEPTRFDQRKGPTARGGAQSLPSSPAVAPTASATAWPSGAGSERRSPANASPFPFTTWRNQQRCPGWNKNSHPQLGVPTLTESEPCLLLAEGRTWLLGLLQEEKWRTEHLSPLLQAPPVWQGPATSRIFISCFSTSPCQHTPFITTRHV